MHAPSQLHQHKVHKSPVNHTYTAPKHGPVQSRPVINASPRSDTFAFAFIRSQVPLHFLQCTTQGDPQLCNCELSSSIIAAAGPVARLLATMPTNSCQHTPQFEHLAQRKQPVRNRRFSETFVNNSQFQAWAIGDAWLVRQQRAIGCSYYYCSGGRRTLLIICMYWVAWYVMDGLGGEVVNRRKDGWGCQKGGGSRRQLLSGGLSLAQ
jgi:hypothetical protein